MALNEGGSSCSFMGRSFSKLPSRHRRGPACPPAATARTRRRATSRSKAASRNRDGSTARRRHRRSTPRVRRPPAQPGLSPARVRASATHRIRPPLRSYAGEVPSGTSARGHQLEKVDVVQRAGRIKCAPQRRSRRPLDGVMSGSGVPEVLFGLKNSAARIGRRLETIAADDACRRAAHQHARQTPARGGGRAPRTNVERAERPPPESRSAVRPKQCLVSCRNAIGFSVTGKSCSRAMRRNCSRVSSMYSRTHFGTPHRGSCSAGRYPPSSRCFSKCPHVNRTSSPRRPRSRARAQQTQLLLDERFVVRRVVPIRAFPEGNFFSRTNVRPRRTCQRRNASRIG